MPLYTGFKDCLLEHLEDGCFRVRQKVGNSVFTFTIFTKEKIQAGWESQTEEAQLARKRDDKCVVLRVANKEEALLFSAYFIRNVKQNPSSCTWDGQTLSFYIGNLKTWGVEEAMIKVRQIPNRAKNYEGDIPLFADDIKVSGNAESRTVPRTAILYIGISGVLTMWPKWKDRPEGWAATYPEGEPVPGVAEFLEWITQHFDVRWCSDIVPTGEMEHYKASHLSKLYGVKTDILRQIKNPKITPVNNCMLGIDYTEDRPWWVVTHALTGIERETLVSHNALDRVIFSNAHDNPQALLKTWKTLKDLHTGLTTTPKTPEPVHASVN